MQIKVIHIDDELGSLNFIKQILVNSYSDEIDLIGSYQNTHDGIIAVLEQQPDILLLDIEMNDMHGFDVAKLVANTSTMVVFLTGQVELVLEAIELSELPYILKPAREVDFRNLIILYRHKKASNEVSKLSQQIANAEQLISSNSEQITSLFVNSSSKIEIIPFDKICYLQSNGSTSYICTKDGHRYTSTKSLSFYEKVLKHQNGFIRCHRSYIVNSKNIVQLNKTKYSFQVLMINGESVDVSYLKKKEVYNYLIRRNRS
ncbi:MAG: response regulator transcription factor [Bacteroidetes bacterium]|nr:response regulator transcription factor [Bacteroidota bacterium]